MKKLTTHGGLKLKDVRWNTTRWQTTSFLDRELLVYHCVWVGGPMFIYHTLRKLAIFFDQIAFAVRSLINKYEVNIASPYQYRVTAFNEQGKTISTSNKRRYSKGDKLVIFKKK